MLLRYILAWIPMVFIGIANGLLREATYGKHLSALRAHQVSTVIGVVLFGFYIWGLTYVWPIASVGQALAIGFIWLGLTVAFEFIFGHYVAGHPWSQLLADYDLRTGHIWTMVLIWITIAPFVFYRFLG